MKVCKIDFEVIKQYWIEVDHFREPNKLIKPFVRRLGPHKTIFDNPRRIAYWGDAISAVVKHTG